LEEAVRLTQADQPLVERRTLSFWQQAALSLFWFGSSAHWSAILITLLPLQAEQIGGAESKGTTLGQILGMGALISMLAAPLFGAWSDRVRTRWGRRMPFLVLGTIGNVAGVLALAFTPSTPNMLLVFLLAHLVINLFNNLATAPYSALIPDVVQPAQRGSASGWMALMSTLGGFVGGITGFVLTQLSKSYGQDQAITICYLLVAALLTLSMIGTALITREPTPPPSPPFDWGGFLRGLREPFRSSNFTWVFWTRFLMTLGLFTNQTFTLYYITDALGNGTPQYQYRFFGVVLAESPAAAMSVFLLLSLAGAILSSLVAGVLSDRYGRKPLVYISGSLLIVLALVLGFTRSYELTVLMGIVAGVGYGTYQAVDWALATDVLPNKEDYAKDMGVWHIAMTLPQSLAAPIGGLLLDTFQRVGKANGLPTLGYTAIFVLTLLYFVPATVLINRVRGVR
jgi:MFS family permease